MDHHCGWPLKRRSVPRRFIQSWLNLNGTLSVSTCRSSWQGWNWLRKQHHDSRWMWPVMTSYQPPSLKGSGEKAPVIIYRENILRGANMTLPLTFKLLEEDKEGQVTTKTAVALARVSTQKTDVKIPWLSLSKKLNFYIMNAIGRQACIFKSRFHIASVSNMVFKPETKLDWKLD